MGLEEEAMGFSTTTPITLSFLSVACLVAAIFFYSSALYDENGAKEVDFLRDNVSDLSTNDSAVLQASASQSGNRSGSDTDVTTDVKEAEWAVANALLGVSLIGFTSALALVKFESDITSKSAMSLPYYVPKKAANSIVLGMKRTTALSRLYAKLAGLFIAVVVLWIVSVVWKNVTSLGFIDFASLVFQLVFLVLFAIRFLGEEQKKFVLIALLSVALWFGVLATLRITFILAKGVVTGAFNKILLVFMWIVSMVGQVILIKYVMPYINSTTNAGIHPLLATRTGLTGLP